MLSEKEKLNLIEEIIASNTFKKATTSSALLRYLAQADIEEKYLKEGIIDLEFFGKNDSLEQSSARVRVSVYNLRKKLEDYYSEDGHNASHRLQIDKGQYKLQFEKRSQGKFQIDKIKLNYIIPYFFLGVVSIILMFKLIPKPEPKIWKNILNNNKNTTVFFEDSFGFQGETITGSSGWTRDYSVNTLDDFYTLLEKNPKLKYKTRPSKCHYTSIMGIHATQSLTDMFTKHDYQFEIHPTTKSSLEDMTSGNMIYIGGFKYHEKIRSLFNNGNPHLKIDNHKLKLTNVEGRQDTSFKIWDKWDKSDMAIISKIPGTNGTDQFIFFSSYDIGVIATVKYFTNSDSLKIFSKKYLRRKNYFTALYRVEGYSRTNISLKEVFVIPF